MWLVRTLVVLRDTVAGLALDMTEALKTLRAIRVAQEEQSMLLTAINGRLKNVVKQTDIDQLTETVNAAADRLSAGIEGVRRDINDLKAANPGVDTTALEASVARLSGEADNLAALDAENPAAPPAPPQV